MSTSDDDGRGRFNNMKTPSSSDRDVLNFRPPRESRWTEPKFLLLAIGMAASLLVSAVVSQSQLHYALGAVDRIESSNKELSGAVTQLIIRLDRQDTKYEELSRREDERWQLFETEKLKMEKVRLAIVALQLKTGLNVN